MLCTVSKSYAVYFFGAAPGVQRREYKDRTALQFAMRRRFGAGMWRIRGDYVETRLPYSGAWLKAAHLTEAPRYEWAD